MTTFFKKWRKTVSLCGWILDIPRVLHFFSASACQVLSDCSFLPYLILLFSSNVCGFLFFHDLICITQLRSCSNCRKLQRCYFLLSGFQNLLPVCSASSSSGYEGNLISLCCSEYNLKVHLPCLLLGACCDSSHPSQVSTSVVINTQKHL